MKIAYLGIDMIYPALPTLLEMGHEILKIFTCPCDNVTEFNTQVIAKAQQQRILYTTEPITMADLQALANLGCELLLCAGYYYRVPITNAFPMVNIHPAPLPQCRGAWPMPLILKGAHPVGGIALHQMEQTFDTGGILAQKTFPIDPEDTLVDYMETLFALVPGLLQEVLADWPGSLERAVPQSDDDAQYLPCPREADWTVTAQMSVQQADQILRAFYGYECLYQDNDTVVELIGGRGVVGEADGQPYPVQGGYLVANRVRVLS